tara:strand:+ start:11615 stop:13291 length:1677 start_codon:yes stop_codon:yes gene_type:complete
MTLGPLSWRHVDDFGPIRELVLGNTSLPSQVKYLVYWFWGSYPPIWHFWAFISYLFADISMDLSRSILLIQGFISTVFSAYLTSCICKIILYEKIVERNSNQFRNSLYLVEMLVIIFNCLNPEIFFHSTSYSPYNLPAITSQCILLLIILPLNKQENKEFLNLNNKSFLNYRNSFLITIFSLLFGFQSTIIIISLFITISIIFLISIFNQRYSHLKYGIASILKQINITLKFYNSNLKYRILIYIFGFLAIAFLRKFILLCLSSYEPIPWLGIDNIYSQPNIKDGLITFISKSLFTLNSILGQSLYPFRYNQNAAAIIISLLTIIGFFIILRTKDIGIIFSANIISIFLATFTISLFTRFPFSPVRHTIFLYPYTWICITILIAYIYFASYKTRAGFRNNLFTIFSISLFISYSIGTADSHSLIDFTKAERNSLIRMASNADYYINGGYTINDVFFQSHGSREHNALRNKECVSDELESKLFTVFIYNDSNSFDINNRYQRFELAKQSNGCIPYNARITIIEKIERANKLGIEQNNLIYNGGSSLFGYLAQVDIDMID